MKPIKCLLLLAAVLSFAAMSFTVDPDEEPDRETCKDRVQPAYEYNVCLACCRLKGKPSGFTKNWTPGDDEWRQGRCVCMPYRRDNPNFRPNESAIQFYHDCLLGSVVNLDQPDHDD
jgi:hypothetical protein